MKEKLENAWMKLGKLLLWTLLAVICGWMGYMVFVHRRLIAAAIKGEPLPEPNGEKCCPAICKRK